MNLKRFSQFVNNNLVMIVCIPMIIGIHWGWSKLQEVPYLVSEKKGMPIVEAVKVFKEKLLPPKITETESTKSQ